MPSYGKGITGEGEGREEGGEEGREEGGEEGGDARGPVGGDGVRGGAVTPVGS